MFQILEQISYKKYLLNNPFYDELGMSRIEIESLSEEDLRNKKKGGGIYGAVNPNVTTPIAPELDDLIRLHFLVRSRRVTTILEFGVGVSTWVLDHALQLNKNENSSFVAGHLRRSNAFEAHSVDNSKYWIKKTRNRYVFKCTKIHFSRCYMDTFNGRVCTFYSKLPNITPDLIYLDGPNLHDVTGDIRGVSTRNMDRLPMVADLLAIEHFLLPGTLLIVDGRSANARFLMSNFQRNWKYQYIEAFDQHFFELDEAPLGKFNSRQIEFSRRSFEL